MSVQVEKQTYLILWSSCVKMNMYTSINMHIYVVIYMYHFPLYPCI